MHVHDVYGHDRGGWDTWEAADANMMLGGVVGNAAVYLAASTGPTALFSLDQYIGLTNPMWASPVTLNPSMPKTGAYADAGPWGMPNYTGWVDLVFPRDTVILIGRLDVSLDTSKQHYVGLQPLDSAGNSPGRSAHQALQIVSWADEGREFVARNVNDPIVIPVDPGHQYDPDPNEPNAGHYSVVFYIGEPDDAHGNRLNAVGKVITIGLDGFQGRPPEPE